jgi:uncharacterized protein
MFTTVVAAIVIFLLLFFGMAIGVVLSNKPVKGSCGGLGAVGVQGDCGLCGKKAGEPCANEAEQQQG